MESEVISNSAAEDTASAAPVQDSAPETVTPPTSAPASGTGSEKPLGSSTPSPADSSKQPDATPPATASAPPVQTPPEKTDWQKRYSDLQSNTDRRLNQMRQQQEQHSQEMQSLRQFRQQQEQRAQQLSLKSWMKGHPDNPKWKATEAKANAVGQQLQNLPAGLPPEQDQALRSAIMSALSPEEQQQLKEHRDSSRAFQSELFADPRGTLEPIIDSIFEERFKEREARSQANSQVEKDFSSPELQPLVQQHAPEIQQALSAGVPYDYAIHMVKMFGELQTMRQQMSGLNKDAVMGKEQQRLAKSNATITRDPAPSQTADSYSLAKKEAEKLGISTDDPRFFKLLKRFDKSAPSIQAMPPKQNLKGS